MVPAPAAPGRIPRGAPYWSKAGPLWDSPPLAYLRSPRQEQSVRELPSYDSGLAGIVDAFGGTALAADEVRITVPPTVDDGSVVPVSVESSLPDTREILIVVDKNPIPLAARVRIPEGTEAFVSMRIKVAESGNIHALVRAGGQVYAASAQTKVTVGGCS